MRNPAQFLTDHFNDPDGVLGLLNLHLGCAPKREAVVKWFTRNSIPGEWVAEVICAAEMEAGEHLDLLPYCIEEDIFG